MTTIQAIDVVFAGLVTLAAIATVCCCQREPRAELTQTQSETATKTANTVLAPPPESQRRFRGDAVATSYAEFQDWSRDTWAIEEIRVSRAELLSVITLLQLGLGEPRCNSQISQQTQVDLQGVIDRLQGQLPANLCYVSQLFDPQPQLKE